MSSPSNKELVDYSDLPLYEDYPSPSPPQYYEPLAENYGNVVASRANSRVIIERGTIIRERYVVLNSIGYGKSAVVYHAVDKQLKKEVALKYYINGHGGSHGQYYDQYGNPSTPYNNEITVLNHLNMLHNCKDAYVCPVEFIPYQHISVLPNGDEVEYNGIIIVQELLCGSTLEDLIAKMDYPDEAELERRWLILGKFLRSLSIVNHAYVSHEDLHPGNIMWDGQDARLIDFGNARLHSNQYPPPFEGNMAIQYVGAALMLGGGGYGTGYGGSDSRKQDFNQLVDYLVGGGRDWETLLNVYEQLDNGD